MPSCPRHGETPFATPSRTRRVVGVALIIGLLTTATATVAQDSTPVGRVRDRDPARGHHRGDEPSASRVSSMPSAPSGSSSLKPRFPTGSWTATHSTQAWKPCSARSTHRSTSPPRMLFLTHMGFIGPDDDLEHRDVALREPGHRVLRPAHGRIHDRRSVRRQIGPLGGRGRPREFTHALQDQRWDLEGTRITDLSRCQVRVLAQQSLIEGDATAVMCDWTARELDPLEQLRVAFSAFTRQDARLA